jgi:hypothetical protein
LEVKKLYGLHIKNDKAVLKEIEPIDENIIKDILYCYKNNLDFNNPFQDVVYSEDNTKVLMLIEAVTNIANEIKSLKEKENEYNKIIKNTFDTLGIDKWETDNFIITKVKDYERNGIDTTRLKEEDVATYNKFLKKTLIKGGIKTKLK